MSCRVEIDHRSPVLSGLFVRDVTGLKSRHDWLPHCTPAIRRAHGEGPEEAARQWDLWWDGALQSDRDMQGRRRWHRVTNPLWAASPNCSRCGVSGAPGEEAEQRGGGVEGRRDVCRSDEGEC